MKKQFIIFFTILCLLCSYIPALAGSLPYNVTFVNSKGNKVDISFANGSKLICDKTDDPTHRGAPYDYNKSIFFKSIKYYFIGWSDFKDFATNKNAKLYYDHEPVQKLIDDGVSTLYAIYLSQMDVLFYLSDNNAYINKYKDDQATVPDSMINKAVDTNPNDHDIVLYYDETKDKYNVSLESNFTMNKMFSHWLYSGNGSTIMTNTQFGIGSSDIDGKNAAHYTHVDLNVNISDEIDLPSELNLTFTGNFFQPYMAINTDTRDKLTIKETGSWKIESLVNNSNPAVTFTVKNPPRHITIRTILRTNSGFGGKKIPNLSASAVETQEMKLTCNTYLNISNAKALEMLKNSTKAQVSGIVDGYVVLPASFSRSLPDLKVKNPISISFKGEHTPIKPTESIKPTEPIKPTESIKPTEPIKAINAPQTGDTSNIALYVVLAVVAVGVFGFIVSKNKRKK